MIASLPEHQVAEGVVVSVTVAEARAGGKGGDAWGGKGGDAWGGKGGAYLHPGGLVLPPAMQARPPPWAAAAPLAQGPTQGVPGQNRVYVFGMPSGLNADMLRGHFARHGEILDIYVPPRAPDMAFVTFSSELEVQDALLNSGNRIAGYTVVIQSDNIDS